MATPVHRVYLFAGLLLGLLAGCTPIEKEGYPRLSWEPIDSLNSILPSGVRAFAGSDPGWPLTAWYARVDVGSEGIELAVLQSDDEDGRETASSFAFDEGACVVLNAGYFRMDLSPSKPIGLLLVDSAIIQEPTPSVLRNDVSYPVARAAIGIDGKGVPDIAWVALTDSGLVAVASPPENLSGTPVDSISLIRASAWKMKDAVSAGPALITDGEIQITVNEEVFFGSAIPDVHPRSALGITEDGALLMLVVDGRQSISRGVDLEQLAHILLDLGAVEAMNLDGGGSSALVVDGVRLNRPAGRDSEREITSAIAAFCP